MAAATPILMVLSGLTDNNTRHMPTTAERVYKSYQKKSSLLTDREKVILEKYYGINDSFRHTLREIGKEMKLSRERVRQLKASALTKLEVNL